MTFVRVTRKPVEQDPQQKDEKKRAAQDAKRLEQSGAGAPPGIPRYLQHELRRKETEAPPEIRSPTSPEQHDARRVGKTGTGATPKVPLYLQGEWRRLSQREQAADGSGSEARASSQETARAEVVLDASVPTREGEEEALQRPAVEIATEDGPEATIRGGTARKEQAEQAGAAEQVVAATAAQHKDSVGLEAVDVAGDTARTAGEVAEKTVESGVAAVGSQSGEPTGEGGNPPEANAPDFPRVPIDELASAQDAVAASRASLRARASNPPRLGGGEIEEDTTRQSFTQGLVSELFDQVSTQGEELAETGETLDEQIAASVERACEDLTAHVAQEVESLTSLMESLRAQAIDRAAQTSALIEAEHEATMTAIEHSSMEALTTIDTIHENTVRESERFETDQIALIGRLYTHADAAYRAAGERVATAAHSAAAARAQGYRAHKLFREDNTLDGYLTDNRCDAEAEAAEKVGQAYAEQLVAEAVNQANTASQRRSVDETAVHSVASEGRTSLDRLHDQAISAVETNRKRSLDSAQQLRTSLLAMIETSLSSALENLLSHEARSLAAYESTAVRLDTMLRSQGAILRVQVAEAINAATTGIDAALGEMTALLEGTPLPGRDAADDFEAARDMLTARVAAFSSTLTQQGERALFSLDQTRRRAFEQFDEAAGMATTAAMQAGEGILQNLDSIAADAADGFRGLREKAQEATAMQVDGARTATGNTLSGIQQAFRQMESNLQQGADSNVRQLEEGLMDPVRNDMPGVIADEARQARDQVQPRWKSVVKWLIIIAIVVVVAVFLGPMVVGFVAGAATALGAGAAATAIGTIVGGILVGGLTSAATTLVDNAFAGRDLTEGLGMAIALGMLGGALGGAVGAFIPVQNIASPLLRVAAQAGLDMAVDTGLSIVTGNFSWENFGTSLALSLLTNVLGSSARVQGMQRRMTGVGHGAGFRLGDFAHARITSRAPLATPTIASTHVNTGDIAGGGPYAGKWNMQGGGHNAGAMDTSPTTAGYSSRTVATDPVSGARIQEYSRPVLDNTGNPVPGAPPKVTPKSQFPMSMGQPHIDAAGTQALGRALAGAPATTLKPPVDGTFSAVITTPGGPATITGTIQNAPGGGQNVTVHNPASLPSGMTPAQVVTQARTQAKTNVAGASYSNPQNGTFSATVLTPEGHPLVVEGYYSPGSGGMPHIETVYPKSQHTAGAFEPPPRFYGAPPYYATPPVPIPRREERDDESTR